MPGETGRPSHPGAPREDAMRDEFYLTGRIWKEARLSLGRIGGPLPPHVWKSRGAGQSYPQRWR
jgi:hypothetical protein